MRLKIAIIIRRWRLFAAIAVASLAFLAYAIDFTSVDVSCNPPKIVSVSGEISGAVKMFGGILLSLDGKEDVWLDFKGLDCDTGIAYKLISFTGATIVEGHGNYLPLNQYPSAIMAYVYPIEPEYDFCNVEAVSAVVNNIKSNEQNEKQLGDDNLREGNEDGWGLQVYNRVDHKYGENAFENKNILSGVFVPEENGLVTVSLSSDDSAVFVLGNYQIMSGLYSPAAGELRNNAQSHKSGSKKNMGRPCYTIRAERRIKMAIGMGKD